MKRLIVALAVLFFTATIVNGDAGAPGGAGGRKIPAKAKYGVVEEHYGCYVGSNKYWQTTFFSTIKQVNEYIDDCNDCRVFQVKELKIKKREVKVPKTDYFVDLVENCPCYEFKHPYILPYIVDKEEP